MTDDRTVLISGAGIAGPSLAHWLVKRGFEPVIVEHAPKFREAGYVIDLWGVGFDAAERMGLIPRLRELGDVNDRVSFVARDGHVRSSLGGNLFAEALGGRFMSIQRGTLARIIYDTVAGRVETIFADEIAEIHETPERVEVTFKSGRARAFGLVVGADGLHSNVRARTFRDHANAERYLGYYAAVFVTKGYSRRDEHVYLSFAAPGRQISRFALRNDETGFLFVFAKEKHDAHFARDAATQKAVLRGIFAREGWIEWPEIERHLTEAGDIYFDAASQVELPTWSKGRVALVGDAAYGPSLIAGEGSAFAMAGAYVLAGELERAGDYAAAFRGYERILRPYIERRQKSARAFASSFVPMTRQGLFLRDLVLRAGKIPFVANLLMRQFVTDRFALPDYGDVNA